MAGRMDAQGPGARSGGDGHVEAAVENGSGLERTMLFDFRSATRSDHDQNHAHSFVEVVAAVPGHLDTSPGAAAAQPCLDGYTPPTSLRRRHPGWGGLENTANRVAAIDILAAASGLEEITIATIRESNARGKELTDLVAVFVGGTAGIGESSAKEFFHRTTRPKAYIIGRNPKRGAKVVSDLHAINPDGEAIFILKDVTLLHSVDEVCADLLQREAQFHCLFLTAGFMTLKGRRETPEGIDVKMSVNYYARVRFILQLMPALEAASRANRLSRVIIVLAAGSEGDVRLDDLDLRHNFTLHGSLAHCVVMTDFIVGELAARYPGTAFSHSYPGTVKTGIVNELSGAVRLAVKVMYAVMTPWILNVQESGERHFFQMTSQCYPARDGGVGLPAPEGMRPFAGVDGKPGSGAYLLDWDGKPTGDEEVLGRYRRLDTGTKVWEHTMQIFAQAEEKMREHQSGGATAAMLEKVADPVGWRAA